MKKKLAVIAACLAFAQALLAVQYSKLGIITAAKSCGKWDALKSWIVASGYEDEWLVCSYLSDDFPQYHAITNAIVSAGVATAEEVAAILDAAHDIALPDALMLARYNRDMKTESGRAAWHGKATPSIDTNLCIRVFQYEDGYAVTNAWTRPLTDVEKALKKAAEQEAAKARALAAKTQGVPASVAQIYRDRAKSDDGEPQTVTVDVATGREVEK